MAYKVEFLDLLFSNTFFGIYSVGVASYILSRFALSLFYRSCKDAGIEPPIAIVMPGFNEEDAIADSLRSLLALSYPPEKLELIAVNDGSTDGTLAEMRRVAAESAREGEGDRLPREPRQARRDGGRNPRQRGGGDRVRRLRLRRRA